MRNRIFVFLTRAALITMIFFMSLPLSHAVEESTWKGNIETSYFETSGNTDTKTFIAGALAEKRFDSIIVTGEALGIYGKRSGVTSDKSWLGRLKVDKEITANVTGFLMETVEKNTLKGISKRYNSQAGAGIYVLRTSANILKFEAGAGYISENPVPPLDDNRYATLRLFGLYEHLFSETARFLQNAEYVQGLKSGSGYLIQEETSLISVLFSNLSLKASFIVFYDSEPPAAFKKSDRLFKTSLVYVF